MSVWVGMMDKLSKKKILTFDTSLWKDRPNTTISEYAEESTNWHPGGDMYYSVWRKVHFPKHLITVVVEKGQIISVEGFVKHKDKL